MEKPKINKSTTVFKKSIIEIKQDQLLLPNGDFFDYYTLITQPASVAILATTPDQLYVINKEYRHPTRKFLLSCPGGFIHENEDPLEAAKRELKEETGYEAESFQIIGKAYPYAGISSQIVFFVKAVGAHLTGKPTLESAEIIETELFTKKKLLSSIKKQNSIDGILCSALLFEHL